MTNASPTENKLLVNAVGIFATLFGIVTVASGGTALFGSAEAKAMAGDVVGFVLWFNFLAGFLYVMAGIGLYARQHWAHRLALFIAVASTLVLLALGWHVVSGNAYEIRTVAAMLFRSVVWIVIALLSWRVIKV